MLKVLDLIFLLRPTILVPVWTFLFLGYFWGSKSNFLAVEFSPSRNFWVVFVSYTLLMGGSYIINQIWDKESDRINKKLFLLSEGIISINLAIFWLLLTLGVSLYLSIKIGGNFVILWSISLVMGVLYSTPPFKFKGRPLLDLLSNALGYGFINFLVGWTCVAPLSAESYLHSLPYIFMVGAVFLNTTVPDIPGDKEAGEITTGVFLGVRGTTLLALVFIAVALILGILFRDPFTIVASVVSTPFFLNALLSPSDLSVKLSYRIGGGSLVLLVSLRYILFLIILIFVYFSLKFYYRFRFGLDYPTLKGR